MLNIHQSKEGGKAWHSLLISKHDTWSNRPSVEQASVILQPQLFPLHANLLLSLTFTIANENTEPPQKGLEN